MLKKAYYVLRTILDAAGNIELNDTYSIIRASSTIGQSKVHTRK